MINLINKLINYYVLKQETELLIPAKTGNRTIKCTQVLKEFCQLITDLRRGKTCNL